MTPFLYIADHGASNPVLLSGARSIQFLWDAQKRLHIWRPKDVASFQEEAAQIIKDERMWKILPGLELDKVAPQSSETVPPTVDLSAISLKALHAELARRKPANPPADPAASAAPKLAPETKPAPAKKSHKKKK